MILKSRISPAGLRRRVIVLYEPDRYAYIQGGNDMNGTDREITEAEVINNLLKQAQVCRIALMNGEYPYVIPMCFGYKLEGGRLELYFHTTPKGQKIDLIKKNNLAGFEIDHLSGINRDENDCRVTALYECITGTGSIEIINGIEKLTGLTSIISKYDEEKTDHKFSEQMLNGMVILKLTADSFCCRTHSVDKDKIDI